MSDTRRLVYARTSLKADDALTLVFEFDPALEYVDKLEVRLVKVRLT